ncbi:MAG: MMPL family transporter [Candidatus Binatia bacterium]
MSGSNEAPARPPAEAYARWLVRHAWLVLGVNLLVTVVLGLYAVRIRIESTLASMLPAGDPEVSYYDNVRATFGSDDVGVIGVRANDLFAASTLEKIARVTDAVSRMPGVERVLSITNAVDAAADAFEPPPLLSHIPPTAAEIERLKQQLTSTPLYGKNLVADDFKGAAINVFFRNLTDAQYADFDIDGKIRAVFVKEAGPERFFYTGAGHLKQSAVELMRHDLLRFTPIALVLVLLVLWLSFWSARGVVLPIVSVLMALVWTLGVMVLAGKAITLGTFVLPPLLIVIGSSYAIHVMARYYEQVDAGVGREEVVVRAFLRVCMPLLISALTVLIGFGSLMVNHITAIWDLGLFAVVGVLFLAVTSLTFIPAALHLLSTEARTTRSGKVSPRLSQWLSDLGRLAYSSRHAILWGATGVAVVALTGTHRIRVDSDFLSYFEPKSPVRADNETINRQIVGSNPFYLVIEGPAPGAIKRWEVLKEIKELQEFLHTLPGLTSSVSIVDYLELLETGLSKTGEKDVLLDEQGHVVPPAPAKTFWEDPTRLGPLFNTVSTSPSTFKAIVTQDFRRANVLVRTNLSGSRAIEDTLARIRAYIVERFPAELRVHPTGNLVLLTGTTSDIVTGQIESLSLALGVIFIVMSLMFLSAKVGFLAILPNVLPIVIFFGVLGWLGILLNLGTSLIAAIALGIAVDSTIHYMARLNLELQGETDQAAAMVRTLRTVGVPIVYATVALFFGFLTFAFSSFVPIQNFGILAGVTLITALAANLVTLPALLATSKIITLWDLVSVRLGKDPAQTIPLFAGLRQGQARIVVLMGQIKRFAPGEYIVQQGELASEMYVIIQGTTEVFAGSGEYRKSILTLRRGEVFGEMALVRHSERSADVVAADNVEVLAINEHFLQRIQRRYPRIASKVFLNLTRIVSDRLQRMTDQYVGRG